MAASLQRLARSAPVRPAVWRATAPRSTSGPSGLPRVCTWRIASRPASRARRRGTCGRSGPVGGARDRDPRAIRGGDDDDLLAVGEAVELDEELVQRLVVLAVEAPSRSGASQRVELVDEDDRWRVLAGAVEELADAGGAEAREHLHEGGRALRVEGRAGGVRDRLGEQRLAGPAGRRGCPWARAPSLEKRRGSLRKSTTPAARPRVVVDAGDVVPGHRGLRGRLHLGRPAPAISESDFQIR